MPLRSILFFIGFALFAGQISAATQELLRNKSTGELACLFRGTITTSEVAAFRRNIDAGCKTLFLSSNGGEIEAAMTMGRALRQAEVAITIMEKDRCASACVLMYAAGVTRANYGPIEIHRPYMTDKKLESFSETQIRYRKLESRVKSYLREMNVNEALYDRMMRISPENAEKLTLEDMDSLGMGNFDPVYDETLNNRKAAQLGMSKQDFLRAKARVSAICGSISGIFSSDTVLLKLACWRREFPGYIE